MAHRLDPQIRQRLRPELASQGVADVEHGLVAQAGGLGDLPAGLAGGDRLRKGRSSRSMAAVSPVASRTSSSSGSSVRPNAMTCSCRRPRRRASQPAIWTSGPGGKAAFKRPTSCGRPDNSDVVTPSTLWRGRSTSATSAPARPRPAKAAEEGSGKIKDQLSLILKNQMISTENYPSRKNRSISRVALGPSASA